MPNVFESPRAVFVGYTLAVAGTAPCYQAGLRLPERGQTFTVFTLGKDPYPEAKADVDAVVGGRRVTFGGKLLVPAR